MSLINSNSEIYGACRHHPKFHRFDTDEREQRERVPLCVLTDSFLNARAAVRSNGERTIAHV